MDQLNTGFAAQDRIKVLETIPTIIKELIVSSQLTLESQRRAIQKWNKRIPTQRRDHYPE